MEQFSVDESQRRAAKIASLAFPISFLLLILSNFGIIAPLIVAGDASQTAQNILAHEMLFRVGIAGYVVYCGGTIIVLTALYFALKPIDRFLALIASLGRLVNGLTWLLISMNLFTALRLLNAPDYLRPFGPSQLQALARQYLSGSDIYYIGLLFWATAGIVYSYLWFKSHYVPRLLALFGIVSSGWCAVCTAIYYVVPDFARVVDLSWFDMPMVVFELSLCFWILSKGLRPHNHG